jgi:hypothetical protein
MIAKSHKNIKDATRSMINNLMKEADLSQNDIISDELNQCLPENEK